MSLELSSVHKMRRNLLSIMNEIRSALDAEIGDEDIEFKPIGVRLLDDVYWELSQAEIHLGRLEKRMRNEPHTRPTSAP
jgi:hypothetical protein